MLDPEIFFEDILPYIKNGKVDETIAPLTCYKLLRSFNLPIGRLIATENYVDYRNPRWALKAGDIIKLGSMEYQDTDKRIKRDNVAINADKKIQFIANTRKFFDINKNIFEDITLQIKRDNKLNQIL